VEQLPLAQDEHPDLLEPAPAGAGELVLWSEPACRLGRFVLKVENNFFNFFPWQCGQVRVLESLSDLIRASNVRSHFWQQYSYNGIILFKS